MPVKKHKRRTHVVHKRAARSSISVSPIIQVGIVFIIVMAMLLLMYAGKNY